MQKKCFIPLLLICSCFFLPLNGQNTPQISSSGTVKKEIVAKKAIVKFKISEVQPNQRNQTPYQPFSETYQNVIKEFDNLGIKEQAIEEEKFVDVTKYQQVETSAFKVIIDDLDMLLQLADWRILGFNIYEVKYIFDDLNQELEDEMAFAAINDALRKAQILAQKANKKVGNVISIRDNSHGCCRDVLYDKKQTKRITYEVKISYELLD